MEIAILNWIHENLHGSLFINSFFKFITDWGIVLWLVMLLALLFFKKTRVSGWVLLAAMVASFIVSYILLKNIIFVERPFERSVQLQAFVAEINSRPLSTSSFPSFHAALAFSGAVVLAFFYGKNATWLFAWAAFISFSRVFLCVHYLSDVVAGACVGIILAFLVCAAYKFQFRTSRTGYGGG